MPMKRFPHESNHSEKVQDQLEWHFDFGRRLYFHCLTYERSEWFLKSGLPEVVLFVSHMLDLQMLRQFRSIYDDCERGEAIGATIISRSLFESLLSLFFVLAPRVYIRVAPENNKSSGLPKPGKFNACWLRKRNSADFLSRTRRAQLFGYHRMIQETDMPKKLHELGMVRFSKSLEKTANYADVIKAASKTIGPEWVHILTKANHCSGLPIATVAELLGRATHRWYKTIYSIQSGCVHSNHLAMLLMLNQEHTDAKPAWFSSAEDVPRALEVSSAVLLSAAVIQQKYIRFGSINEMALNGLKDEFKHKTAKSSELEVL